MWCASVAARFPSCFFLFFFCSLVRVLRSLPLPPKRYMAAAKLFQTKSCLTLCNPMDCSPPGSSVWGFSRQEYRSGLPCPHLGIFPIQGRNRCPSHVLHGQAGSLPLVPPGGPSSIYSTGQHHPTLCEDSHLTCRLILRSACKVIRVTCL